MSEFAPFGSFTESMGFVRDAIVLPPPTVRVVGPWAGTAEGRAILDGKAAEIRHTVTGLRQQYHVGVVPSIRKRIQTPTYTMEYLVQDGKEIITLEPFPVRPSPKPKEIPTSPPDALVLEFLWDFEPVGEPIPYWYPSGNHWITGVKIGDTVPFPWGFVCGPTSATINGYPFFGPGTGNIPPFTCDTPPYPAQHTAVGFSAPYEFIWKNTSVDPWYSGGGAGGSGGGSVAVEITAAGPDACNGVQTGVIPVPPGTPYTEPWSSPMLDDNGNMLTRELLTRWKGSKDVDPHRLLVRAQVVGGPKAGEYVGANGGVSSNYPENPANWDSYDGYALIPPGSPIWDGRLSYGDGLFPGSDVAQVWWDALPWTRSNAHNVILDARYYRREVVTQQVALDLFGFWRNPRHFRNMRNDPYRSGQKFWSAPDGRGPMPTVGFSGPTPAAAYVNALFDTAWYTEPTPPITPRNIKLVATWVWGIAETDSVISEAAGNLSSYAQQSFEFDARSDGSPLSITAYQTGANDPAAPTELPWGTLIGRLYANFETRAISLTLPAEG